MEEISLNIIKPGMVLKDPFGREVIVDCVGLSGFTDIRGKTHYINHKWQILDAIEDRIKMAGEAVVNDPLSDAPQLGPRGKRHGG